MRKRFLFFLGILFIFPLGIKAQRVQTWGISIISGVGFSDNVADFTTLPGISAAAGQPDSPYSSGGFFTNPGFHFGGFVNLPFLKDFFFRSGISFENINSELQSETQTVTLVGGVRTPLVFTHTVDASFTSIPLNFSTFYSPLKNFAVGVTLQPAFLVSADYVKSQRITQPEDINFLEGGKERTDFDGALAGKKAFQFGAGISAQYTIPITRQWFLKPEVSYTRSFTDVAANTSWRISPVRVSAGVEYAFLTPKELLKDTIIQRDTTLQLVAFNAPDTVILNSSITNEATSDDIDFNYELTTIQEIYHHFIPKPAPLLLADMRVRFLKDSVETESISLVVEDSLITRTILTGTATAKEFDTIASAKIPLIIFYPEITSEAPVQSWNITVTQQGKIVKEFKNSEALQSTSISWNPTEAQRELNIEVPLEYTFSVTDAEGQTAESPSGKITFQLQKKENPPGAQLPAIRELFYFEPEFNSNAAIAAFKKRSLKTQRATIIVENESMITAAQNLAKVLKIPSGNISVAEVEPRFKNMIAVIVKR